MRKNLQLSSLFASALVMSSFVGCGSGGQSAQAKPDAAVEEPAVDYSASLTLQSEVDGDSASFDNEVNIAVAPGLADFFAQAKGKLGAEPGHVLIEKVQVAMVTGSGAITKLEQIVANPCTTVIDAESGGGDEYEVGAITLTQGALAASPRFALETINAVSLAALKTGDAKFILNCAAAPGFAASATKPVVGITLTFRATK